MKNMMIKSLVAIAVLSTACAVSAAPNGGNQNGGLMKQMSPVKVETNTSSYAQQQLNNVRMSSSATHGVGGLMKEMTPIKVQANTSEYAQKQLHNVYMDDIAG
jgi:hypothetical protein